MGGITREKSEQVVWRDKPLGVGGIGTQRGNQGGCNTGAVGDVRDECHVEDQKWGEGRENRDNRSELPADLCGPEWCKATCSPEGQGEEDGRSSVRGQRCEVLEWGRLKRVNRGGLVLEGNTGERSGKGGGRRGSSVEWQRCEVVEGG